MDCDWLSARCRRWDAPLLPEVAVSAMTMMVGECVRRKSDLPTKLCAVCGRPFVWRKKWEKVWQEVRYCSERCRRSRNSGVRD